MVSLFLVSLWHNVICEPSYYGFHLGICIICEPSYYGFFIKLLLKKIWIDMYISHYFLSDIGTCYLTDSGL